ncbi:bifunctional diguanylate cyclase/phosphodiesterase [Sulfurimonas paralvinellae]|uniref:EAL domain-containing protein n=1 Tax=Sulfurimonas paralvinellae TaxID=317658 RepID=A0A7M1B641_9BACT|nr:GGDEF and EAL domain-containing protein [Sulfurimonas paralvinellae]QOP45193.1 EAL domain-containing protein [Sulfurimonas paralvinellae]
MIVKVNNKEEYFKYLNSIPVAIVIASAKTGLILHANPKAEALWMRSADDLVGKPQTTLHSDYWNAKGRETFSTDIAALESGQSITHVKNAALRSDGKEVPIEITAIMVEIDGERALVGTFISIEAREKAYVELHERERELNSIFENSQIGIMYLKGGRYLYKANQRLADILGYDSPEEMEGISMEQLHLSHERFVWFGEHHYKPLSNNESSHINYELRKKNGERVWISLSGKAVDSSKPADLDKGVIWIIDDISDYKALEEKLVSQNKRLENLLENINGISWEFDLRENRFVYVSQNAKHILGYEREEWTDLDSWKMMLHPEDREETAAYCMNETQKGKDHLMEYRMVKKDGSVIWVLDIVSLGRDKEGNPISLFGFIIDITQQKNDRLKIESDHEHLKSTLKELEVKSALLDFQAHHDALTGLPNRTLYYDRIEQAIQKAKRNNSKFVLFFIDLDHFKEVNDSLGHDIGDQILLESSKRLSSELRAEDTLARLGGDEFTVLLENIEKISDATHIAQKIIETFRKPFIIEGRTIYLSCSIGISIYPDDGTLSSDLLKYADNAMYKAKDEGRDNFQFYTKEMTELAFERVVLESNIRQALINDEFTLYYQPQFNGSTKEIIGMEALIRWEHPSLGLIPPSKFIPLAEESSLIIEIDNWVMKTAMKQIKEWYDKGLSPGVLSLNLAIKQLESAVFLDTLKKRMDESSFLPEWLKLEVLERDVMRNPQDNVEKLNLIHKLGVELALDDFGTGQSSLTYLKRFPLDELKIDRSFIKDINQDAEDDAIVMAIIALAKSMKLNIIAEGVETEEQLSFLLDNGCQNIQGYYFSKPLNAIAMEKLLKE